MTTKQAILRNVGIAILATSLLACDGAEERKIKYMAEGQKLFDAGDYEKAQIALKNVLQIDPKHWESRFLIAESLSKQGKIENAFREYNTIVANDENHVMARVRVGQLLLLNRAVDDAQKMAAEALAKAPDNVEALILMAGVQMSQKDSAGALVSVQKARQLAPEDVSAMLMLSSIHLKDNQIDEAVALLKQGIEKKPDSIPLHTMLTGIYAKTGRGAEAEQLLRAIIQIQPNEAQHYRNLALFQLASNQTDKAEATLRDAVAKLPDNEIAQSQLIDFLVEKRSVEVAIAELLPLIEQKPEAYPLQFKLASLHLANKQIDKAEETLKAVVDRDKLGPSGISARNKLASIYAATQRPDQSKALIDEVLKANPRDAEALTLRGQFALAENKIPEAIGDFRSVLVDQPNNANVLKLLAASHLRNNEPELARETMEKVVAQAPADETARMDLVALLLKDGHEDRARQQIEDLLKANPKSQKGLEALFRLEMAKKQWGKAQEVAIRVQQAFPDDAAGFHIAGLAYQADNKLDNAVAAFKQALVKKPDAIEPLTELVRTLMVQKQAAKAIALLQDTAKRQPTHFVAYNLLGGVYLSEQKLPEAKAAFSKAKELKPDWFSPYRNLALMALLQKNRAEAIDIYTKGLEKTQWAFELVEDLARLHHAGGEHDKVLALYEEFHKRYPDSPVAINNLASYLSDYAATPENLERAAKLAEPLAQSNNASFLDTVGWIAYQQGNLDKAKTFLTKALEIDDKVAVTHYHLGLVYYKLNDKAKATEHLQRAVDSNIPFDGLDQAKKTLETLKAGG